MRCSIIVAALAILSYCGDSLTAQEAASPEPIEEAGRFELAESNGLVVMLDKESGDSWFLHVSDQEVVWLPIPRVDDELEAQAWIDEGAGPLVENTLMSDLARARAQLKRLQAQYGAQHPLVLSAAEEVRELQAIVR